MSIQKAGSRERKKVLVGLSGGIDSAVAACLLKREGFEVTGVHMRFWADGGGKKSGEKAENKCCTLDGMTRAIYVARKIGIPLVVLNFEKEFKKKVVDFYVASSEKTLTPNPCVECNRHIKFGLFFKKMKKLGADCVATGHYARVVKTKNGYALYTAKDRRKDQSYFLYTLTGEKLKKVLFPLGGMLKSRVRRLAREFGIDEINEQKESQDLCFLPGKTPESFLRKHVKKTVAPGPILTSAGACVGTHCGLPFYTIGQRKGLGIGGIKNMSAREKSPWYVAGFKRSVNGLIVGPDSALYSKKAFVRNLSFVEGPPAGKKMKISAKIRYGAQAQPASLEISRNGPGKARWGKNTKAEIIFSKAQRAVTPGQSIVFYQGEKIIGGGIIARKSL